MKHPLLLMSLTALLALPVYLLLWPVEIEPVAWNPQPAPSLEVEPYAPNQRLMAVQRLAAGALAGPEAIAIDARGQLHSGLEDGRIVRVDPRDGRCTVLANTGGRPLGLQFMADGRLAVADARKGLLSLSSDGRITPLAEHADGLNLGFADGVDVDGQGRIYFTDASWKSGYGKHTLEMLEHGAHGRLLRWQPELGEAVTLLAGLRFANGVALGPNDDYVLVAQTSDYRITRYWMRGPRAGSAEVFIDNLPGFPDNITFNGRDRFWVALVAPRSALLDTLAPHPFWRRVIARLPAALMPGPAHMAFIVGLDLEGRVVEQYRATQAGAYAPITSVREHDGHLYLGSLSGDAIGRVALSVLRGAGPVAPAAAPLPSSCAGGV